MSIPDFILTLALYKKISRGPISKSSYHCRLKIAHSSPFFRKQTETDIIISRAHGFVNVFVSNEKKKKKKKKKKINS